jgi:hypothetical protein
VFVIFITPVALGVPAMLVLIPPPVVATPAMLASFMQIVARSLGCLTAIAMMLDGLMQPVIGSGDSTVARFISISAQSWSRAEHDKSKRYSGCKRLPTEIVWQSLK